LVFADRLDGCSDGGGVDAPPSADRFEGFHWTTPSVERTAAMPNSTLHNCFHIDMFGRNLRRCIKWGLVAIGLTISVTQANAEYQVNIGDVLEMTVAGVPELRHRAVVQVDGNISLPLVGMLPVAGLPLPQIRAQIGAALASKVFRQRTQDGREAVIVIDADEVTATVAE
jgi:polysaccharide export outer membrane protein